jgi:hypothetical protein
MFLLQEYIRAFPGTLPDRRFRQVRPVDWVDNSHMGPPWACRKPRKITRMTLAARPDSGLGDLAEVNHSGSI